MDNKDRDTRSPLRVGPGVGRSVLPLSLGSALDEIGFRPLGRRIVIKPSLRPSIRPRLKRAVHP